MRFSYWDSTLYGAVADRGYPPPTETCCYQAFFPGFPMAMRWGSHLFGGDYFWAGFALVQVASAAAALLLWWWVRDQTGSERTAWLALTALAIFPTSLFLTVVYTEAPFLAASLGAWYAARRGRWAVAAACAALASTLRINALFLTAGLVLIWWETPRARRHLSALVGLAAGPAVVAAYLGWLWHRSGRWNAWAIAQEEGWQHGMAAPWVGLGNWAQKVTAAGASHLVAAYVLEGLATIAIVVIPVVLARRRMWPEAALTGLNALALVCTTSFISNARFLVVWFPLFLVLGERLAAARPAVARAWLGGSLLLLLAASWSWGLRHWVA